MRFFCAIILGVVTIVNCFQNDRFINDKLLSLDCSVLSNCEYEFDCDYTEILDAFNVCVVNQFYINDRLIIEGYSNDITDYVVINNQKINMQISVSDDMCILGVPLIKNSF
jgi:hypothetical protein